MFRCSISSLHCFKGRPHRNENILSAVAEVDEYNRERLQSHHFAPQQCKDFYKNVEVDPKFRDCPLRTGVPMWREFETCLNR